MAAWAYILECSDGSFYTGCTTDLLKRYGEHQTGRFEGYTSTRLPVVMVWSCETQWLDDAIRLERQIKGWSRLKKQALIDERPDLLQRFAKSGFSPRSYSTPPSSS